MTKTYLPYIKKKRFDVIPLESHKSRIKVQTLISKLLSNIVICAGSGVTSLYCSFKFLNEPYAPITCAVCGQRLSSPKAIFFLFQLQLSCFTKVKQNLYLLLILPKIAGEVIKET